MEGWENIRSAAVFSKNPEGNPAGFPAGHGEGVFSKIPQNFSLALVFRRPRENRSGTGFATVKDRPFGMQRRIKEGQINSQDSDTDISMISTPMQLKFGLHIQLFKRRRSPLHPSDHWSLPSDKGPLVTNHEIVFPMVRLVRAPNFSRISLLVD